MKQRSATLCLLLAAACTPAPIGNDAPADTAAGALLFARQGCSFCHGSNADGRDLGPDLRGLQEFWTRDDLAAYILEPSSMLESNAHLREVAEQFSAAMPESPQLDEVQRLALADYLLGLPAPD